MKSRSAGNKYILGWIKLDPANRIAFTLAANDYARACRAEEGCLFFELVPHHEADDTFLLAECFVSEEAHKWHHDQEHFVAFVKVLNKLCLSGRFENVIAASVRCDEAEFG